MKKKNLLLSAPILLLVVLFSGCYSLAEDLTPPPGMEVPSAANTGQFIPTQVMEVISFPQEPPDPNSGARIYSEKCLPCHGENGMGDGPDAAILENGVPALGSIELAQTASPADWYTMVTQGNMQAFMPPFASLSDQERWDVVAYLYTLSAPAEVVAQGKTLFVENCVECHGEDGSEGVVDLRDQAFMGQRSAQDMLAIISAGHELMPAFEFLNSNQQWAITAYLRQASFVPYEPQLETEIASEAEAAAADQTAVESETEADLPSEEPEANPGFANVQVTVLNNSEETLPSDLEIVLRGYDEMTETYTQTLPLQEGNEIQFKDVPVEMGRMYFATIEHANAVYGSNVFTIEEEVSSLSLEIPYYPATTNTAVINVDRMHIFIDFIDEQTLEIFQLYIFSNPSNQVLVPNESAETVINFVVPENASNLYVEDNMRLAYRKTADGFGITNIYPDADPYQAVFSYQVPYDNNKLDMTIPIGMDANALIVLAPASGFKLKSDQLVEAGTREFEGVSYNMYTGSGMQTGDSLLLHLSGSLKENRNFLVASETSNMSLVIGLGGFGVALIVAGLFLWRRNRVEEDEWTEEELDEELETESIDDLMDAILALDDQHRAGSLPEDAYQHRRAEMKERLRAAVESE